MDEKSIKILEAIIMFGPITGPDILSFLHQQNISINIKTYFHRASALCSVSVFHNKFLPFSEIIYKLYHKPLHLPPKGTFLFIFIAF